MKQTKKTSQEGGKLLANDVTNKGLIFKIYKYLYIYATQYKK